MTSAEFGLDGTVIEKIRSVFMKHSGVHRVILYGSRAKGTFRRGSDIDLTIQGLGLTTSDLLKIENEIDDLLLPYKVDLSLLATIESTDLLDHIKRAGVEFYVVGHHR